ncbi:MAG: sulfite exporter TauE/SafE family protein [Rhodoblastus sp.]|nr:sulfite exporter TauE/SafE family protein [Rhodoblastus sp.]
MVGMTTTLALGTVAIVFAAATLRGLTGFGFALAAVPMLGLLMPPAQAVPVSMCIVAVGGVVGARQAMTACHWPSIRRIGVAAVVGTPAGVFLLKHIPAEAARIAIALFTLAAVLGIARAGEGAKPFGAARAIVYGLVAGVFNGLAAMSGPPIVAYFMSSALSREAIRASMLVIFQIVVFTGLASALALGLVTHDTVMLAGLSLPAFWIGNWVGARLFAMGSEQGYRRIAIACLVAMALASAAPAVSSLLHASR